MQPLGFKMSLAQKIQALHLEIDRLKKAKQSSHARHIDIANLMNAQEKLRNLELESAATLSDLRSQ